jgi:hypothetical protein
MDAEIFGVLLFLEKETKAKSLLPKEAENILSKNLNVPKKL